MSFSRECSSVWEAEGPYPDERDYDSENRLALSTSIASLPTTTNDFLSQNHAREYTWRSLSSRNARALVGQGDVRWLIRKLRAEPHLDARSEVVAAIADSGAAVTVLQALGSIANADEDKADLLKALETMVLPATALNPLLDSVKCKDIDVAEAALYAARGLPAEERLKFYATALREVTHEELRETIKDESLLAGE